MPIINIYFIFTIRNCNDSICLNFAPMKSAYFKRIKKRVDKLTSSNLKLYINKNIVLLE